MDIPLSEVYADNTFNCRGEFSTVDIITLANDFRIHGQLSAILVRPSNKYPGFKYHLVAGHRRYRAAEYIGWKTIRAEVKELTDDESEVINLVENIERKDLNMMQEARSIERFLNRRWTLEEIGQKINKSATWVQIRKKLLDLPPDIQDKVVSGMLNQSEVQEIARQPTIDMQYELVRKILDFKADGFHIQSEEEKQAARHKKKLRGPEEIFAMQEKVQAKFGISCFGARCLAWAGGAISDEELESELECM